MNSIYDGRLLVVDDNEELCRMLTDMLHREGFRQVYTAGTCAQALSFFETAGGQAEMPDLVILDINLPDGNGFDFLGEVKAQGAFPVILLTANDLETDIVAGLEAGADDYITKPFSLAVLRARVNTQLRRRTDAGTRAKAVWSFGRYRFCFDRMEYYLDGKPVELSRNEQKLLRLLVENEGMILKRETLMDRIWTDGAEYVDENALSVTVKRLRDKLEAGKWIETIYGTGYRWVRVHG